jgi:hypothetical protein
VWIRRIAGVVLCVAGAVWIGQGFGAVHGSFMSGHQQYAALGIIVTLAGIALIGWPWRRRGGS